MRRRQQKSSGAARFQASPALLPIHRLAQTQFPIISGWRTRSGVWKAPRQAGRMALFSLEAITQATGKAASAPKAAAIEIDIASMRSNTNAAITKLPANMLPTMM